MISLRCECVDNAAIITIKLKIKDNQIEMVSLETHQETFNAFEDNHNDMKYVEMLNTELFSILYSRTKETRRILFLDFYAILAKVFQYEEGKIRFYMLTKLDPKLADEILESVYPGLTQKFTDLVDRKKVVEKMDDKLLEKEKARQILSTLKRILLMQVQYIDLIKDTYLVYAIFNLLGGVNTVVNFVTKFSSVISLTFLSSIIAPSWIGTLYISLNNPGLIFIRPEIKLTRMKHFLLVIGNFLCCFINPILIINSEEQIYEKLRFAAKSRNVEKTEKFMKMYRKAQVQRAEFHKLELGKVSTQNIFLYNHKCPSVCLSVSGEAKPLHPSSISRLSSFSVLNSVA